MRKVCPQCNSTAITLESADEGWEATGPYGNHLLVRRYSCEQCGHEWTERHNPPTQTEP